MVSSKGVSLFFLYLPCVLLGAESTRVDKFECDVGSHTMRADARHSEGAGVGYKDGYTTLEGFFSAKHCTHHFTPFVDLRGHIFNDKRYAANAGAGVRYLSRSVAWGVNGYYDYRSTHELHYNQWGIGLEAIGSWWSVNINGYLPFGKKRSDFFDFRLNHTPFAPDFAFFQGNRLFITSAGLPELVAKQEFAFKGIDANWMFQVLKKGIWALDAGIDLYYFKGAVEKHAAGGRASLAVRIGEYLTLSASSSYDNLFHLRTQGSIGLSIPFGPRNFAKECKIPSFLNWRLTQGANRNEIIVLDRRKKTLALATAEGFEIAINPITGQPYFVWFVNNLSHSDGTFESPYPTIQEALAVAQPDDIIYVYPGDSSPYDVDIALTPGQFLLGSGTAQSLQTTKGSIVIPAQSSSLPNLENTMGSTMITVSDRNTVSGFNLNVLSPGNTVVATGIDSLFFQNNRYITAVTVGMNNLVFTDCIGTLLVQNNQFVMDAADTGSLGIVLSDAGSGASTLSVLNNTFTNHASRAISLNYSGSSSPTLNIGGNAFAPPAGFPGTTAIDLTTSNMTTLAGSISSLNQFLGYTANVMNLNWGGSGNHALSIIGNTISSDASVMGTTGVFLFTNTSGGSAFTVTGNSFTNQTNTGLNCSADGSSTLQVNISGNTLVGTSQPGNNGIQVSAANMATITGSITSNTSSGHLGNDISGFFSGSSNAALTIASNTLNGPTIVPPGSFPQGVQFNGSGSSSMNLNINHNQLTNHANVGINLFVVDTATATASIDSNRLTVPDSVVGTSGILISAGNSSAVTSTYMVTSNTCIGHTNANIQCFPTMSSVIDLTISGNTLAGPTITPMGSFPNGIQISASNSVSITARVNGHNHLTNHSDRGINVFSSDDAAIEALIDGNTVSAPISTTNTSGITVGGNNTSSTPSNSYTITNNVLTGHNNGSIQCFPSQDTKCELIISNNAIISVVDGIAGSGPLGVQVNAVNNSTILSALISYNTWTSPNTYQPTGTPQGFSVGASNTASISNVNISHNIAMLPLTSYQAHTSPSGIQTYLNDSATMSGLTIANNSVNFSTATYTHDTGPGGIQVNAQGSSVLTGVTVSNNSVSFAILPAVLSNFQGTGIALGCSDTASIGTALSPAVIEQNTVNHIEGNGIILLNASSSDSYVNVLNNTVSLGTVLQSELGILTVPFGMGKLIADINGNTVVGNNGGFVGIIATNQGPVCQSVTIRNNTVTDVHGNNPMIPIPDLGGGIGAAILNAGDLVVFTDNNGVSGNTPQGIFGLDSQAFGGSGILCITLQNNHGAGVRAPDNYVLYNPTMANPLTFTYQNLGGNTGTLIFSPSMADFTPGVCVTCP